MELLNFLKQIPFPVLLVAVLILLVVTLVIAFQYAKHKGLEAIPVLYFVAKFAKSLLRPVIDFWAIFFAKGKRLFCLENARMSPE